MPVHTVRPALPTPGFRCQPPWGHQVSCLASGLRKGRRRRPAEISLKPRGGSRGIESPASRTENQAGLGILVRQQKEQGQPPPGHLSRGSAFLPEG